MVHVAPVFHIQNLWKEEAAPSLSAAGVPGVVAFRPSQNWKASRDLEKHTAYSLFLGQETSSTGFLIIKTSLTFHDKLLHCFPIMVSGYASLHECIQVGYT